MEEMPTENPSESKWLLLSGALGALGLMVPGALSVRLAVTGVLLPVFWIVWGLTRRRLPFTAELMSLYAGFAWLSLWVLLFPFSLMFSHAELVVLLVAGLAPIPLFVRSRPLYLMMLVYAMLMPQILMLGVVGTDAETQLAVTVALSLFAWAYSGRCCETCGFYRPPATDSWMAVMVGGVLSYSILTKHITTLQNGLHFFSPALSVVWLAVPVMLYLLFYRAAPAGRRELPTLLTVLMVPALYLVPASPTEKMTVATLAVWGVLSIGWMVLGSRRRRWGWIVLGGSVLCSVVLDFVNSRLRDGACDCDIQPLDNFWLTWLLLVIVALGTWGWWRMARKGDIPPEPLPADTGVPLVPAAGNGRFVVLWTLLQLLSLCAVICFY